MVMFDSIACSTGDIKQNMDFGNRVHEDSRGGRTYLAFRLQSCLEAILDVYDTILVEIPISAKHKVFLKRDCCGAD